MSREGESDSWSESGYIVSLAESRLISRLAAVLISRLTTTLDT